MRVASFAKANNVVSGGFVVFTCFLLMQQQFQLLICTLPICTMSTEHFVNTELDLPSHNVKWKFATSWIRYCYCFYLCTTLLFVFVLRIWNYMPTRCTLECVIIIKCLHHKLKAHVRVLPLFSHLVILCLRLYPLKDVHTTENYTVGQPTPGRCKCNWHHKVCARKDSAHTEKY